MSMLPEAPKPKTPLGVHRILSPRAGVRVSPLCLGAMSFGDAWKQWLGECDKKTTFEILDYFYENGGNFIDTANNYQNEESETWIGEWMKERGIRDEIVLATKYTTCHDAYKGHDGKKDRIHSNMTGNGTKSLHVSVERSLKKLQTDYIDVLYLHWWDHETSIEEVMQSLNNLVKSGKVLYLAVSDTPAWIVSRANQYARDHGLAQFVIYQGMWNAAERDMERDIIPMGVSEGMAFAPWKSIGGGMFKTAEQRAQAAHARSSAQPSETYLKVCDALEKVAKRHNVGMTSIALAYVVHKAPNVFPIVGGRKVEHLKQNIEALLIELSDEDMKEITSATDFSLGFPHTMIGTSENHNDNFLLKMGGRFVDAKQAQPIRPADVRPLLADS